MQSKPVCPVFTIKQSLPSPSEILHRCVTAIATRDDARTGNGVSGWNRSEIQLREQREACCEKRTERKEIKRKRK